MAQLYIGLMSGTSMDGVSAALVDLQRSPRLVATAHRPFEPELRARLQALAAGLEPATRSGTARSERGEIARMMALDAELGQVFAAAARELLAAARRAPREVVAIGSHGQTLRHYPNHEPPATLQIADPNVIAAGTGITTVADFRRRDLAAGGQGAPLAPAFHAAVFRTRDQDRAVVNIGGIANITVLPADPRTPVTGFDTGPGNTLMDAWALRHLKQPMDREGRWATSGRVDARLLELLLQEPYFAAAPPKSTGPEHFNLTWLERALQARGRVPRKNVQATLCELTAVSIAQTVRAQVPDARQVLICGGGVHNLALMFRLQMLMGEDIAVRSTEDFGVHPDWVEAMAFAWLAQQTLQGRPGNLPSVTGASQPVILGGIYPGGTRQKGTEERAK